jgi:hypothetical protein
MGWLIKIFAIFLIIYFLLKFSKFILKSLFYMVVDKPQEKVNQKKRPKDGNVDVDYVPNDYNKSKTSRSGDYVDYEEIK